MTAAPPPEPNVGGQAPREPNVGGQAPREPNVGGQAPREPNVGGQAPPEPNVGGQAPPEPNVGGQASPDPWKSFRGVMAGTLILEIITVLLALPVVAKVAGGLTAGSTAYLVGFAVLLGVLAGLQGRSWAIWANLAVQLLLVAGWVVYPAIGFMGVLFLVVWAVIAYLRGEVLRRQRLGLLPGQQPPQA